MQDHKGFVEQLPVNNSTRKLMAVSKIHGWKRLHVALMAGTEGPRRRGKKKTCPTLAFRGLLILFTSRSPFIPSELAKLERQRGFGDQESHRNGTSSSSSCSWSSYQDQNFTESNSNHYPHYHHFNGGPHSHSLSGRKRAWHHHQGIHPAFDHVENASHAKLYVSQVPRTATEPDIRPFFEQYGNIVEIVVLKDKRTGLQQGNCFVKYATIHEADRAIAALNNRHTFRGEISPITVKYADGEKERLGVRDKVFVAVVNKEASVKEIEEIFSPYGVVEDVYIVRDEMKQSRGCGFVKFSHPDMALAAIKALNGNYTMRGCDQPLAVRFAEPKKSRSGESRSNNMNSGMNFGPPCQEPVARSTTNFGGTMPGHNRPNAPHFVQHFSSTSQQQAVLLLANQEPAQSSQSVQQIWNSETSSQPFQVAVPDMQKQSHLVQPTKQILEQQQWSQPLPRGSSPQAVASNSISATAPISTQMPKLTECDWSEHTCPDGYKYYYNCVTCESMWEKPKEFALFEEQVKKQVQEENPCHQLQSCSPVISTQQPAQPQGIQDHTLVHHHKHQLEKPSSPVLSTQQPAQPEEIQNHSSVLHQKLQLERPSPVVSTPQPAQPEEIRNRSNVLHQEPQLEKPSSPALSTQLPAQSEEIQNHSNVLHQELQLEKPLLSTEQPAQPEEIQNHISVLHQKLRLEKPSSPVVSTQQPAQPEEIRNHINVLHQELQLEKPSSPALSTQLPAQAEEIQNHGNVLHQELQLEIPSSPILAAQQPAQPEEIQNPTDVLLHQNFQLEKPSSPVLFIQQPAQPEEIQSHSDVLSAQQPAQPEEIQNHTNDLHQNFQLEKPSSPVLFIQQPAQPEEIQNHSDFLSSQQPAQPEEIQNQTNDLHQSSQLEIPSSPLLEPDQVEVQ